MKTLKQTGRSAEAEDRQEEIKGTDNWITAARERKFRKQRGPGHTGKK